MSKQSDAKKEQGYTTELQNCGSCNFLQFTMDLPTWMKMENSEARAAGREEPYGDHCMMTKSFKCGKGGFTVKKTATCDYWYPKNAVITDSSV